MVLYSRAPIRVDFAGGTTDLKAFRDREGGAVLNAAIARYAYCSARDRTAPGAWIDAQDLPQYEGPVDIREAVTGTSLELLRRALDMTWFTVGDLGIEVTVRADSPPGSGTGTSASVGVALLGLLDYRRALLVRDHNRLGRHDMAELACSIENDIGIVGGKQDQYAAAVGGLNYMEFVGDRVCVERVEVSPDVLADLEKHLVLCHTGESRLSGDTNAKMIAAYESGDAVVVGSLQTVKRVAGDMARALRGGDMGRFADLMNEEYEARIRLHGDVLKPRMAEMVQEGKQAGALAVKICGAGGGGCLLLYCAPDKEKAVREALEKAGGRILDFTFESSGVQVWRMDR